MKSLVSSGVVLTGLIMLAAPSIGNCDPKVGKGMYVNATGLASLDLKSGGKANFTMMTEKYACTYEQSDEKLMLDCTPDGEKSDFMINSDGSLTGPGFMGGAEKIQVEPLGVRSCLLPFLNVFILPMPRLSGARGYFRRRKKCPR